MRPSAGRRVRAPGAERANCAYARVEVLVDARDRRHWALTAVCTVFVLANGVVAAHAWRFTHFAADGMKTANPEALSWLQRIGVAFTGVVVPRPELTREPSAVGLEAVASLDDGVSTWTATGSGRGTVLLFHGYGATRSDLLDEAVVLHGAGWTTVLVDFPGSGDSPGDVTTLGWAEAAVVAALTTQRRGPVVLYGKSMGSAAVLRAMGSLGAHADALVLENPYDRLVTTVGHRFEAMGLSAQPGAALLTLWGGLSLGFNGFAMEPVEFATGVDTPTLLLTGEADPRVHLSEVASIQKALAGPSELVVFPRAGHVGLFSADAGLWRTSVLGFLDREVPKIPGSGPESHGHLPL